MFIDEIQAMQERGEQLRKLRNDATDEEFANLQRQLTLLDAKCPRYDVYNVFWALNSDHRQRLSCRHEAERRTARTPQRPRQLGWQGTDGAALVRVQS